MHIPGVNDPGHVGPTRVVGFDATHMWFGNTFFDGVSPGYLVAVAQAPGPDAVAAWGPNVADVVGVFTVRNNVYYQHLAKGNAQGTFDEVPINLAWYVRPTPGILALGPNNIYVGYAHYDGTAWSSSAVAGGGMYGGSFTRGWAANATTIHMVNDTSSWCLMGQTLGCGGPALSAVWGVDAAHVWGVGRDPAGGNSGASLMYFFNGTSWSQVGASRATLTAVWAASTTHVWAVGSGGTILHFDGAAWSQEASGTTNNLTDLWGSGPDSVWAVGAPQTQGTWCILHRTP